MEVYLCHNGTFKAHSCLSTIFKYDVYNHVKKIVHELTCADTHQVKYEEKMTIFLLVCKIALIRSFK